MQYIQKYMNNIFRYICNVCNISAYKIYLQYFSNTYANVYTIYTKYAEIYADIYAKILAKIFAKICANINAIYAKVYIMYCNSIYALPTLLMESQRVCPPAIAQPGRAPCGRPTRQA